MSWMFKIICLELPFVLNFDKTQHCPRKWTKGPVEQNLVLCVLWYRQPKKHMDAKSWEAKGVFILLPSYFYIYCANCVVLLHSIYCIHFPAGLSTGKGQKMQLSTYLMQTNMFHRQVQQQEACGFVSDTVAVSGAPGAKDRSALSVTSCCLLTFSWAHYYTVVVAAFHSRLTARATRVLSLGLWDFSVFLQDTLPQRCITVLPGNSDMLRCLLCDDLAVYS